MDLLVGSAILIVGLFLGALLAWTLNHGREAYRIQAAVSNSQASSLVERAQLEERLKAATEELRVAKGANEQHERELVAMRAELEKVREEQSRFAERSSRVPGLEADVNTLNEKMREVDSELRQVSTSEAQKEQLVTSLTADVSELQSELRDATSRLEMSSVTLQEANERRAALEEQCARIPSLEASARDYEKRAREVSDELRRVSASEAQKQQHVTSLIAQVSHLETELSKNVQNLSLVSSQLHETNERKAALEEQVPRIPELERKLANTATLLATATRELSELRESNGRDVERLSAELSGERLAATLLRDELASVKSSGDLAQSDASRLTDELTELRTRTEAERQGSEEKLALLLQAKEMLSDQFKTLASDILEEKSKRFTEQNQVNLGQLLEPLKTRLSEFQGKVEEVYVQEGKDRSALSEQVRNLVALNQVLSQDAKNLTSALKGSSKTQGNWGELILERVLEGSGLRKGEEYIVQDSQVREDGSRAQPDVVINLPEDRKLVIDSKVSLVAYDKYASAETEELRAVALRQHVDSLRNHIRSLSDKQYQALYGKSLDFVLAFVPIEPAFMLAVANDNELFMDAWRRNVLLVSPSTLLFVVRTVAHLWRQEAQSRNAQDIARRGAELYDRLVGFVDDLQIVGNKLNQAQKAYEDAHKKLSVGKGNVIRQAELLRGMGVKPSKALPQSLVEMAAGDEDGIIVPGALASAESPLGASIAVLPEGQSPDAP